MTNIIKQDNTKDGKFFVSTIYIPDMGMYETMVFNNETGETDVDSSQCETYDTAMKNHAEFLKKYQ